MHTWGVGSSTRHQLGDVTKTSHRKAVQVMTHAALPSALHSERKHLDTDEQTQKAKRPKAGKTDRLHEALRNEIIEKRKSSGQHAQRHRHTHTHTIRGNNAARQKQGISRKETRDSIPSAATFNLDAMRMFEMRFSEEKLVITMVKMIALKDNVCIRDSCVSWTSACTCWIVKVGYRGILEHMRDRHGTRLLLWQGAGNLC